jgi:hypothetical protein
LDSVILSAAQSKDPEEARITQNFEAFSTTGLIAATITSSGQSPEIFQEIPA